MKKVFLVFVAVFLLTLLLPALVLLHPGGDKKDADGDLVTIFNTGCYSTTQYSL